MEFVLIIPAIVLLGVLIMLLRLIVSSHANVLPGKINIVKWEDETYSLRKRVFGFYDVFFSGMYWYNSADDVVEYCKFTSEKRVTALKEIASKRKFNTKSCKVVDE